MRRLLLLPVLALMAVFLVASPASAATVDSFTVNGSDAATATVDAGVPFVVAWSVTSTRDFAVLSSEPVIPGFDNADANPRSSTSITLDTPGTYDLTVAALDDGQGAASETITVTVRDPSVVTPAPVVVENCELVVPDVDGVAYLDVDPDFLDEEDLEFLDEFAIDPGRYPISGFSFFGDELEVFAVAEEGFSLPEGAVTAFVLPIEADCLPTFVETQEICQGVTFTNVSDEDITVFYIGFTEDEDEEGDAEGDFTVAPGASRTVETTDELLFFVAGRELDFEEAVDEDFIEIQFGEVEVEQDCVPATAATAVAPRAAHPTVAPAAGQGAGPAGPAAIAALLTVAAAGVALRRRLS